MATPNVQNEEIGMDGTSPVKPTVKGPPSADDWLGAISYLAAGIAAIGLLVVMSGVFLIRDDLTVLIGVSLVSLAAAGWTIVGVAMIVSIIRRWSSSSDKASKSASPTKTE